MTRSLNFQNHKNWLRLRWETGHLSSFIMFSGFSKLLRIYQINKTFQPSIKMIYFMSWKHLLLKIFLNYPIFLYQSINRDWSGIYELSFPLLPLVGTAKRKRMYSFDGTKVCKGINNMCHIIIIIIIIIIMIHYRCLKLAMHQTNSVSSSQLL